IVGQDDRGGLPIPALVGIGGRWVWRDERGEVLVLHARELQRKRLERLGVLDDVVDGPRLDVEAAPIKLAEEDVAEGAGVPLSLDRNAVRAEQVVAQRTLVVGTLELQIQLEAVGPLLEPISLRQDETLLVQRGLEDNLAAGLVGGGFGVVR